MRGASRRGGVVQSGKGRDSGDKKAAKPSKVTPPVTTAKKGAAKATASGGWGVGPVATNDSEVTGYERLLATMAIPKIKFDEGVDDDNDDDDDGEEEEEMTGDEGDDGLFEDDEVSDGVGGTESPSDDDAQKQPVSGSLKRKHTEKDSKGKDGKAAAGSSAAAKVTKLASGVGTAHSDSDSDDPDSDDGDVAGAGAATGDAHDDTTFRKRFVDNDGFAGTDVAKVAAALKQAPVAAAPITKLSGAALGLTHTDVVGVEVMACGDAPTVPPCTEVAMNVLPTRVALSPLQQQLYPTVAAYKDLCFYCRTHDVSVLRPWY